MWFYTMKLMAETRVKKKLTHSGIWKDHIINDDVQNVGLCINKISFYINTGLK